MKVAFFTVRDRVTRRPIHTVCIYEFSGRITSGLAKCGKKDIFNRKMGRKIAFGRAQKAMRWHSDLFSKDGWKKAAANYTPTNAQQRLLDTQNPAI